MVLNYRRLPYSQSYSKMSDVIPICKAVGQTSAPFTFPLLALSGSLVKEGNPAFVRDSLPIALYLESAFPPNANHHPSIFPTPASHALAVAVQALVQAAMSSSFQIIMPLLPRVVPRNEEEKRWFVESRSEKFGQSILEMKGDWKAFEKAMRPIVSALEGGPDKVGPFFEGKTVAYADFILVAFVSPLFSPRMRGRDTDRGSPFGCSYTGSSERTTRHGRASERWAASRTSSTRSARPARSGWTGRARTRSGLPTRPSSDEAGPGRAQVGRGRPRL